MAVKVVSLANMTTDVHTLNIDGTDEEFDAIYPTHIQRLARKHWTSISVAKTASEFLVARRGMNVLDIGSGVGKFCMVGALHTRGHFTGVEQRASLTKLSNSLASRYNLDNVNFIHGNVTGIDFREFQSFYFYNPFFENIDTYRKIDDDVILNSRLFTTYSSYTFDQLACLGSGTRLGTYFTESSVVPSTYSLIEELFDGNLKLWEKMH